LAKANGDPRRRQAVIRDLVYQVRVTRTDINVALRDIAQAKAPIRLSDGTAGTFDFGPVWLPETTLNATIELHAILSITRGKRGACGSACVVLPSSIPETSKALLATA
jgi:hypothetical protein